MEASFQVCFHRKILCLINKFGLFLVFGLSPKSPSWSGWYTGTGLALAPHPYGCLCTFIMFYNFNVTLFSKKSWSISGPVIPEHWITSASNVFNTQSWQASLSLSTCCSDLGRFLSSPIYHVMWSHYWRLRKNTRSLMQSEIGSGAIIKTLPWFSSLSIDRTLLC